MFLEEEMKWRSEGRHLSTVPFGWFSIFVLVRNKCWKEVSRKSAIISNNENETINFSWPESQ